MQTANMPFERCFICTDLTILRVWLKHCSPWQGVGMPPDDTRQSVVHCTIALHCTEVFTASPQISQARESIQKKCMELARACGATNKWSNI